MDTKTRILISLLSFIFIIIFGGCSKDSDEYEKSSEGFVKIEGLWYNLDENTRTAGVTHPDPGNPFEKDYSGNIVIPQTVNYGGNNYNVTSIDGMAFSNSFNLISVTVPNSVDTIDQYAFWYCINLISVTISDGVKWMGDEVFEECTSLKSIVIPNGVTTLGYRLFFGCTNLASVTIPNSVTSIGKEAFMNCTSLTSVVIPDNVTVIDVQAFAYCSGLTSVTIGKKVSEIRGSAFESCTGLTDIYCMAENVPPIMSHAFEDTDVHNIVLHVPAGKVDAYKAASFWSVFKEIVALPENVD